MFKKTLAVTLLLVLAFTFTFTLQPSADELPAESYAKYFPADTFVFAEFKNISESLTRLKELSLYKLGKDEEVQDFVNEIVKLMNRAADEDGEDEIPLSEKIEDYLKLFGAGVKGKAFMAISHIKPEEKDVRVIMGAEINEQTKPAMQAFFEKAKNEAIEQSEGDVLFNTFTYEGYEVTSISAEDAEENETAYFVMTEKLAFLAIGKKSLESFLANLKTPLENSLYANPKFVKLYKKVHSKEMFWYSDMQQYFAIVSRSLDMVAGQFEFIKPIFTALTNMTSSMGGGVSFEGVNIIDEMVSLMNMDENAPKLQTILASMQISCEMKSAHIMPKNSMIYFSAAVPVEEAYQDVMSFVGPMIEEQVKEIENTLMLTLKDDILPAFGNEIGFAGSFSYLTPDILITMELKKPEVIEKVLSALQAFPQMIPIEEIVYLDKYKLYVMELPNAGTMGQIALAVKDNWLYIGLSQSVQSALVREGDSLATNLEYQKALSTAGQMKINGMTFVDVKNILSVAYDTGMPFLQSYLAAKPEFDPTTIPSKEAITANLVPFAAFYNYSADHTKLRSTGPFPYSAFQLLSLFIGVGSVTATQMPPAEEEEEVPEDVF